MMERFARFREFMETFEENPELLDKVERFADELGGD